MYLLTYILLRTRLISGDITIGFNSNLFLNPVYRNISIDELDLSLKNRTFNNRYSLMVLNSISPRHQEELELEKDLLVFSVLEPKKPYYNIRILPKGLKFKLQRALNIIRYTGYVKVKPSRSILIPISINITCKKKEVTLKPTMLPSHTKKGLVATRIIHVEASETTKESSYLEVFNTSKKSVRINDLEELATLKILE